MDNYSTDRIIRVWDDEDGEYVYVGPDGDALGLVELRVMDTKGTIGDRISMPREQAMKVADALKEYCADERNFVDAQ